MATGSSFAIYIAANSLPGNGLSKHGAENFLFHSRVHFSIRALGNSNTKFAAAALSVSTPDHSDLPYFFMYYYTTSWRMLHIFG